MSNNLIHSLVLDQSTTTVGWAVINNDPEHVVGYGVNGRLINHGVITTPKNLDAFGRICVIESDLKHLIKAFPMVSEVIVEDLANISQLTGSTQQALAWVLFAIEKLCRENKLALFKQNPATVKKIATTNGKADKEQMKQAAMELWDLSQVFDDNHADALCGAYAWLFQGDEKRLPKVRKLTKN